MVLLSGSLGDGRCGVGDFSFHLARHIARLGREDERFRGTEVYAITATDSGLILDRYGLKAKQRVSDGWEELEPGFFIKGGVQFGLCYQRNLAEMIAGLDPDVVLVQYPSKGYGKSLGIPLLGLLKRRTLGMSRKRFPFVLVLHEYRDAGQLRKMAVSSLVDGADRLITPCPIEAGAISRTFDREPVVIPNGNVIMEEIALFHSQREVGAQKRLPPSESLLARLLRNETIGELKGFKLEGCERESIFELLSGGAGRKRLVFSYGYIVPSKEPMDLFCAFQSALEEIGDADLVLASKLDLRTHFHRRIKEFIESKGLARSVHFVGTLPAPVLKLIAERSRLQVYTFRDGFTTKRSSAIGALAFDTPMLIQMKENLPGVPIETVPPGDVIRLSAGIIKVLSMNEKEYGDYLRETASRQSEFAKMFDFDVVAGSYMDALAAKHGND